MTREEYWNMSEEERKNFDEETKKKGLVLSSVASGQWSTRHEERESRKDETRNRIRAAYEAAPSENAVFIPAKKRPNAKDNDGERTVAVYARVSTKSEEQVSSIENQTHYYSQKVEGNPDWTLAEIYADEGKSGTSIRKRSAFRQMIEDAKEGKMDLILCASVSRFARNVTDCIEQTDILRTHNAKHPVEVFFETEQISTLDPDATLNLQIHAILADWESANKSRRMILSYDQRICTGQYPVSDLLGYRHTKDGQLIIEADEAVTVRFIFLALMLGYSYDDVAEILTEHERKTLTGRTEWNGSMVRNIILNERRWGDLDVRKAIVLDYKKGKVVKNTNIRDKAYVTDHHEGIVTPEIARAVHAMVESRDRRYEVADVEVIAEGALKGFVVINPYFAGIDRESILALSKSVYTENDYSEVEHRVRIMNGEEHSKVVSMEFAGYKVPYSAFLINASTPTMTVSRRSIKFNKKCHDRLNTSNRVELLYHPLLQELVIRECEGDRGFEWSDENDKPVCSIVASALTQAIYSQQDWIIKYDFRFRGISRVRGSQNMLMFYLDEPQIVGNKAAKKAAERYASDQESLDTKYIPFKNSELDENGNIRENAVNTRLGMMFANRKKRDEILDNITEEDISMRGVARINPYIGAIPSREEIEEELEELLLSM